MLRKWVLLLAAAGVVAAAKLPAPVASADQAWDGGGCHADLFPQDTGGCALKGELFQESKTSRYKGRFQAEVQQLGTMEAQVACGHAVRACGQLLACRCPKK